MIDLTIPDINPKAGNTPYTEGMIDDALKAAADIDTGKIKDAWEDSDKSLSDKMKTLNDEGLAKGASELGAVNRAIKKNQVDTRSIVARARNSVLQFPIYITQTNRVNAAHTIAKLFERVYTTLVQTVLSQNQLIDEEEANNLVFLKQFHSNLKESASDVGKMYGELFNEFYEPIDDIDAMLQESIFHSVRLNDSCLVEFRVMPTTNAELIAENARLVCEPLEGLGYVFEAVTPPEVQTGDEETAQYRTVTPEELKDMAMDDAELTAEEKRLLDKSDKDLSDDDKKKKEAAADKIDKAVSDLKKKIKDGEIKNYSVDDAGRVRRYDKTRKITKGPKKETPVEKAVDAPKLLRDADIKKLNGMLPYTIEATFRLRTKQGLDRDVRYIIGIKSVLHLIRTQDLADDLQELVTGNLKTLKKVRYKTGEISFRDYMFNIKGLKADAAKHINYNKRWLNTLKRLADYKKMNGSLMKRPIQAITGGNVPIPNGTLILAQPDVTTLTNQTGIDLSNVGNAKRLARSLFLIAIAIVDASAGTMRVLFPDSDNDWDVQSLAAVDAELAKTDNSQLMKELNRLVNR